MAESPISPYNLNDLKNTTDDALGNYLRGLSFKQNNQKLDLRLIVGYLAVIIAAGTFAADYKLGWEATKNWTAVAVALYAALNGVFTYILYYVEAGLVFEGAKEDKKVCKISLKACMVLLANANDITLHDRCPLHPRPRSMTRPTT